MNNTKNRLDHFCEIIMGQAPKGEAYNFEGKGWRLIAGAGDFGDIYPQAKKYTTEASKLSQDGDIILGIRASIGDKVLSDGEYCLGRGVACLRPRSELNIRYLWHWLDNIKSELSSKSQGATFKQVNREDICDLYISPPLIDQQKRIAAILDKAEELRRLRRQSIEHLDVLSQSIFIEMFGDPVTNPKGWDRVTFSDLLLKIESGHSPNCLDRPVIEDKEWGVLKLGAITSCKYNPLENKALPPNEKPHLELEVKVGDLLFTRKNTYELVAACALVLTTIPNLLLPDLIFRFRLKLDAPMNSSFLHQLLINPAKRREIQKLASGSSSSMPNISKAKLQSILIEVPPLSLQQEFAQRIESIESLKAKHRESLAHLDTLFTSLQHRAFRGEL